MFKSELCLEELSGLVKEKNVLFASMKLINYYQAIGLKSKHQRLINRTRIRGGELLKMLKEENSFERFV